MTIHTMMTADESGKELVELAQQLAQTLVRNGLTSSQIRNIFHGSTPDRSDVANGR
jgi:hypothetical protein